MTDFHDILSSVSIPEILDHKGIHYRGRRCRCPIHGGNNSTAFSFTDDVFNCFVCGVGGGKLDLIEKLSNVDRNTARRILCENIAGVSYPDSTHCRVNNKGYFDFHFNPKGIPTDLEAERLKELLGSFDELQDYYTRQLRKLRERLHKGSIKLVEYYTNTQFCDHVLIEIDERYAIALHKLHERKKRS